MNEYINGIATFLPNESRLFTESPFPFGLASDECFASWNDGRHAGMNFLIGNETAQTGQFNNWGNYYKAIRKANIVISRIGECKDMTDMERRDYTGRAYFLRGYFYFCLLRQYGPVPLVPDTPFEVDTPADQASIARNTYDECVDYICNDMEKAAEFYLNHALRPSNMLQLKEQLLLLLLGFVCMLLVHGLMEIPVM